MCYVFSFQALQGNFDVNGGYQWALDDVVSGEEFRRLATRGTMMNRTIMVCRKQPRLGLSDQ